MTVGVPYRTLLYSTVVQCGTTSSVPGMIHTVSVGHHIPHQSKSKILAVHGWTRTTRGVRQRQRQRDIAGGGGGTPQPGAVTRATDCTEHFMPQGNGGYAVSPANSHTRGRVGKRAAARWPRQYLRATGSPCELDPFGSDFRGEKKKNKGEKVGKKQRTPGRLGWRWRPAGDYVHHPVLGETHDYRNYNL